MFQRFRLFQSPSSSMPQRICYVASLAISPSWIGICTPGQRKCLKSILKESWIKIVQFASQNGQFLQKWFWFRYEDQSLSVAVALVEKLFWGYFQLTHHRVRRSKECILIVSGIIDSGKENFSLKETVRERGESRCTQALRKADFLRRSAMVRYSTISHN